MRTRGGLNRLAILAILAMALAVPAGAAHAYDVDARAEAVINRSKAARQTYAVYEWTRMTPPGRPPVEQWSAEFNDDGAHRVETPQVRVVANCDTGAGVEFLIALAQRTPSADVGKVACGINTRGGVLDTKWLAEVDTPFGRADRVELTDAQLVRTYDVTKDGVIVRTEFHARGPGDPLVLASHAVALQTQLPVGNLFDEVSLDQSYVPEAYKTAPKP